MSNPFGIAARIPDDVESVVIGLHLHRQDLKASFHVIVDDVVLCSGDTQPNPGVYQRVTREGMTPARMPDQCGACRNAAAAWAGHSEWVEGEDA